MANRMRIRDVDKGAKALLKRMASAQGVKSVRVGVLEAEGSAEAVQGDGLTVLDVAVINEFGGAENNPPARSFIAGWADENEAVNQDRMRAIADAVVRGAVPTVEQGLERFGVLAVADVQKRIVDGIAPANAESTIARKGSSTPLVDTGQLKSAIAFQVVEK